MHTKPRQATTLVVTLLVSASLLIDPQAAARAQEPAAATTVPIQEREHGVELYRQGNIKAAVKALRAAVKQNKTDADAWYFLSLALNRDGDTKDARKAVEKSVRLRPNFAPARAGKARILTRPEPLYSGEARKHRVRGTIVMRAVFAADRTVQHVLVLRSLPHGLTELAVKAARRIKFVPATKDGRPVSQFIQIEYNFNLY